MCDDLSESERKVNRLACGLRCWASAFLVIASMLAMPAVATEAADPFVPGFWNPDAVPDKPDLSGIGTIRFVTTNDYPPFGFALANGVATGFDVDLARAICAELQVTCTIQARRWDTIVPALLRNQADAAIASIAITDQARRDLAFAGPYYRTPARFVVRAASPLPGVDAEALAGKRIGVVAGSAHQAYLKMFFPKAVAVPFDTVEAARAALKAGSVDAVFGDAVTWALWMNGADAAGCCAFAGGPFTEARFFGRGAGIAVRKGDVVLRQALDYALARVAAKGTYGDLYLKYFPLGLY